MIKQNSLDKQEELVNYQTWEDIFNLTIDIAKLETHCATLAYFKKIEQPYNKDKKYGIATFLPIPFTTKQSFYEIQAYYFSPLKENLDIENMGDEELEELIDELGMDSDLSLEDKRTFLTNYNLLKSFTTNKLYCIIFTDYNFKNSIEAQEQTTTADKDVHSLSFGVVLDL